MFVNKYLKITVIFSVIVHRLKKIKQIGNSNTKLTDLIARFIFSHFCLFLYYIYFILCFCYNIFGK